MPKDETSQSKIIAPIFARHPHFTVLNGPAPAHWWTTSLMHRYALWRRRAIAWPFVDHACIFYGPSKRGEPSFPASVAERLSIPHIAVSADDWLKGSDLYVGTTIAAIVRTFDDAARSAPCVLSFHDLEHFLTASPNNSPFWTCATSALLSEIEDALKVPGLVVILTQDDCNAAAQALRLPEYMDWHMAVRNPGRAANDNGSIKR